MIIRRQALQAVLPAVNADDATHRTDKIEIRPDGTVTATDGHILLSAREATPFPDEDFPVKDIPARHGNPAEPVTISKTIAERLIKGTAKKPTIPILQAIQLSQNGEGAFLAATDLESPTVIRVTPAAGQVGTFPVWERILPKAEGLKVTISAEVLAALAKAITTVTARNYSGTPKVTLYIPTEPQHQGLDKAAVLADGGREKTERTTYGGTITTLLDKHGQTAAARDYPNGEIVSALRLEIDGTDGITIVGAIALCIRGK